MVKEKVMTGKYKDCPLIYDHIKTTDGQEIYFNNFSVMSFEAADQSKADYWTDTSRRVDGATSPEQDKDRRLISVGWRSGEKSILQVNSKTYNRLMEAMFGKAPPEHVDTTSSRGEKPRSKAVPVLFVLVCAFIIIKFFLLK